MANIRIAPPKIYSGKIEDHIEHKISEFHTSFEEEVECNIFLFIDS